MPENINRKSLTRGLLDVYETQHSGGAFDSKKSTPDVFGLQEKFWTKPGFVNATDEQLGFGGSKTYDKSLNLIGFNNKKYKP